MAAEAGEVARTIPMMEARLLWAALAAAARQMDLLVTALAFIQRKAVMNLAAAQAEPMINMASAQAATAAV